MKNETQEGHASWFWYDVPNDHIQNEALRAYRFGQANFLKEWTSEDKDRMTTNLGAIIIEYRKVKSLLESAEKELKKLKK